MVGIWGASQSLSLYKFVLGTLLFFFLGCHVFPAEPPAGLRVTGFAGGLVELIGYVPVCCWDDKGWRGRVKHGMLSRLESNGRATRCERKVQRSVVRLNCETCWYTHDIFMIHNYHDILQVQDVQVYSICCVSIYLWFIHTYSCKYLHIKWLDSCRLGSSVSSSN